MKNTFIRSSGLLWLSAVFAVYGLLIIEANREFTRENSDFSENQFADFDAFDEDDDFETEADIRIMEDKDDRMNLPGEQDEAIVEEIGDFEGFDDEEEYERSFNPNDEKSKKPGKSDPELSVVMLPGQSFNYFLEITLILCLAFYFINYLAGKFKNTELMTAWIDTFKPLLKDNFAYVGDDGSPNMESSFALTQESEHIYTIWCSGRSCCEGMLVELRFLKRQDLIAVIGNFFKEKRDQIHLKFPLAKDDMDTYVFCIANKKSASKLSKEMVDLNIFCPERKAGEKFDLPSNFAVMSEMNEIVTSFLDSKSLAAFNKYSDLIDYVHVSDRFAGPKVQDEDATKPLEYKRMFLVGFSFPTDCKSVQNAMDYMIPLMNLVFYWLEKLKRCRLSKEGKAKADKNRARVEEALLKTTHHARTEAAAARREEKKRKEKERILQEEDPDKQRRWEEKEMKKQMKKKIPKMKQLKVKAL